MLEFWSTQLEEKNNSAAPPIVITNSTIDEQSENHITASQLKGLFGSQNDTGKNPSASTVKRNSSENQSETHQKVT